MAAGDDQRQAELLAFRFESVASDLQEIKVTMRELAQAVARLAVVEERQSTTNDAVSRAFAEIERVLKSQEVINARITRIEEGMNERLRKLELAQPLQAQTTDWVQRIVWIVLSLAVVGTLGLVMLKPVRAEISALTGLIIATGAK